MIPLNPRHKLLVCDYQAMLTSGEGRGAQEREKQLQVLLSQQAARFEAHIVLYGMKQNVLLSRSAKSQLRQLSNVHWHYLDVSLTVRAVQAAYGMLLEQEAVASNAAVIRMDLEHPLGLLADITRHLADGADMVLYQPQHELELLPANAARLNEQFAASLPGEGITHSHSGLALSMGYLRIVHPRATEIFTRSDRDPSRPLRHGFCLSMLTAGMLHSARRVNLSYAPSVSMPPEAHFPLDRVHTYGRILAESEVLNRVGSTS